MRRTGRLTLVFSLLFAVLFIGPALLSGQFGPYPLIKVGDALDLFTPFVLIPLYWLLLRAAGREPSPRQSLVFLILAAAWVQGQGIHLAANSIGHLLKDFAGSDVERLTYFYDERLSHYLWHAGIVGLSALLLAAHWQGAPEARPGGPAAPIVGGILHGLTFFIIVVEGATGPLGVPFAAAAALGGIIWGRGRVRQRPLLVFFAVAYVAAVLLFAGWALYWGDLREPSKVWGF